MPETVRLSPPVASPPPVAPTPRACPGRAWPPSVARIHDVQLGGSLNFAADRILAGELDEAAPGLGSGSRAGRRFVRDAILRAARAGVGQFLDLGCGVSAADGVYPAAQAIDPACRIVHVDVDPVAIAHARAVAAADPHVSVLDGDVRNAAEILGEVRSRGHLDLRRPVAIIAAAMLHFVPGSLTPMLRALCAGTAPGSMLVLSHLSLQARSAQARCDAVPAGGQNELESVRHLYARTTTPVTVRSPTLLRSGLIRSGWRVLPPGIGTAGPLTPGGLGVATAFARH